MSLENSPGLPSRIVQFRRKELGLKDCFDEVVLRKCVYECEQCHMNLPHGQIVNGKEVSICQEAACCHSSLSLPLLVWKKRAAAAVSFGKQCSKWPSINSKLWPTWYSNLILHHSNCISNSSLCSIPIQADAYSHQNDQYSIFQLPAHLREGNPISFIHNSNKTIKRQCKPILKRKCSVYIT